MNICKYVFLSLLCLLSVSCSKNALNEEEQESGISLYDISGTWLQYAYLCSDGYFVDVSDTGNNMYYEFAFPNKFIQYTVNEAGEKEIIRQGEWVYNTETMVVHVTEPQGWNLDITFNFGVLNDFYIATMKIKGHTPTSSSTIKARLIK